MHFPSCFTFTLLCAMFINLDVVATKLWNNMYCRNFKKASRLRRYVDVCCCEESNKLCKSHSIYDYQENGMKVNSIHIWHSKATGITYLCFSTAASVFEKCEQLAWNITCLSPWMQFVVNSCLLSDIQNAILPSGFSRSHLCQAEPPDFAASFVLFRLGSRYWLQVFLILWGVALKNLRHCGILCKQLMCIKT